MTFGLRTQRSVPVMSRRDALRWGGGAILVTAFAGCSDDGDDNPAENVSDNPTEAPMLADDVEAGALPPLEERLPVNPLVIEPVERIGVYGGQWRSMILGLDDIAWFGRTIDYDQLLTWDPEFTGVFPNLAESFEANEEGTVFTLGIRQGVRWSDGEPFTVDDVIFAYDDVLSNREISPIHPAWVSGGATSGNKPAQVARVDEHTVQFTFDQPNGLFLQELAAQAGANLVTRPRHYLEQFHQEYNADIETLVEDEGFEDWVELFTSKGDRWRQSGVPVLTPWMTEQPLGEGTQFVAVRNPYYWKTDPNGSQLPYLDRVVFDLVGENEVMVLKINNGEVDMHARHVMSPRNKPVFAEAREDGDFDFFDIETTDFNQMKIDLNLTHLEPGLREVFTTKEFRVALSHAINRQEIIDAVFQGQGEPWQTSPRPESPFYNEEYAKQYTEYDPDLANQILDDAGFERDGNGVRLRPDGEPIAFDIEVGTPSLNESWIPALELVREYWLDVGVDARIAAEDRSLFFERVHANQHDASVYVGEFGDRDGILWPESQIPVDIGAHFAVGWGMWYASVGAEGIEPPPEVQRQLQLFDEVKETADDAEREDLWRQVLAICREQFYSIGIALPVGYYGIVKNTFHNVPEVVPGSFPYPTPAPTRPEQYFTTA